MFFCVRTGGKMPVSKAQFKLAAMSKTVKGRAALKASGKKPMPMKVGAEMLKAGKGKYKSLPAKAKKKKV